MSQGLTYDHFGNVLNEGDYVELKGTIYRIVEIRMPQIENATSILDITRRAPLPTIRIVSVRVISDITIQGEANKKMRDLYKIVGPSSIPDKLPETEGEGGKEIPPS